MIIKVDVSPEAFARLMKAVRVDDKFLASLVFEREKDVEFFGTGGGPSLVTFLKDTKLNLDTGKMSVTLEVKEIFGAERYLEVPRIVPDILFDILGIFPQKSGCKRREIVRQIEHEVGEIWAYGGSPTPSWLRDPLHRIGELLVLLLEKA